MNSNNPKQLFGPFLLLVTILVCGGACSKEDAPVPERPLYNVIELNQNDNRFENLQTIYVMENIECQKNSTNMFKLFSRNDSLFIIYFDSLLYPTRLPDDFPIYGNPFIFSGTLKQKPENADYYPLILDEFKYELLINMNY